jgi:hypothetical protein
MTTPNTPAPAAAAPTLTPDEDFAAAFGEINPPEHAPDAKPAVAAAAPAAADAASEIVEADPTKPAPAAAAGAEDDPNATPAPATPDPAAASTTAPVTTPAAAPDPFALIEALQAEVAALKNVPAPAAAPEITTPPPPLYTAEEKAILDAYNKEWPDMARGEALVRRQEYVNLAGYIFAQIDARLQPLESNVAVTHNSVQYNDIVRLVPDYETVRDLTLEWVETQPAFLKKAYHDVANTGTAEEVAEMIGIFKKETGYVAPAASAPAPARAVAPAAAAAPAAPATPTVSAAAAAAAKALKPVVSGRSEPTTAADPNDFDAGWADYSKVA